MLTTTRILHALATLFVLASVTACATVTDPEDESVAETSEALGLDWETVTITTWQTLDDPGTTTITKPGPYCGDEMCNGDETVFLCPLDCGDPPPKTCQPCTTQQCGYDSSCGPRVSCGTCPARTHCTGLVCELNE